MSDIEQMMRDAKGAQADPILDIPYKAIDPALKDIVAWLEAMRQELTRGLAIPSEHLLGDEAGGEAQRRAILAAAGERTIRRALGLPVRMAETKEITTLHPAPADLASADPFSLGGWR